jgi:AraC-like DNA-binding protein
MFLLRETDQTVTDICLDVGFNSLGTFSRTFHAIVGQSPSEYRQRIAAAGPAAAPTCFAMAWSRPSVLASRRGAGSGHAASTQTQSAG